MEGNKVWVVHHTRTYNGETISIVHGVYERYYDADAALHYLRCESHNTSDAEIDEVIIE